MAMIFPGMDPYLENPQIFPGIHGPTVVYLRDQLAPRYQPRYIASVGERVYVGRSRSSEPIGPDVRLRQTHSRDTKLAAAGTALADEPVFMGRARPGGARTVHRDSGPGIGDAGGHGH